MPNTLNELLDTDAGLDTIIPGTTPVLKVKLKDSDLLKDSVDYRLDVSQDDIVIIQSAKIEVQDNVLIHVFSQEETYRMFPGKKIKLQIHGLTDDDTAWKTNILELKVGETLSETMI